MSYLVGVYLLLNGTSYNNNSVISITDVGMSDLASLSNNGLQCITDKMPCCDEEQIGKWLFPNGTSVPERNRSTSFYVSRGQNDGTVILNRLNSSLTPTGNFCCVIPDAFDMENYNCITLKLNANDYKNSEGICEVYPSILILIY